MLDKIPGKQGWSDYIADVVLQSFLRPSVLISVDNIQYQAQNQGEP